MITIWEAPCDAKLSSLTEMLVYDWTFWYQSVSWPFDSFLPLLINSHQESLLIIFFLSANKTIKPLIRTAFYDIFVVNICIGQGLFGGGGSNAGTVQLPESIKFLCQKKKNCHKSLLGVWALLQNTQSVGRTRNLMRTYEGAFLYCL